jgi:hypothetical protein
MATTQPATSPTGATWGSEAQWAFAAAALWVTLTFAADMGPGPAGLATAFAVVIAVGAVMAFGPQAMKNAGFIQQ